MIPLKRETGCCGTCLYQQLIDQDDEDAGRRCEVNSDFQEHRCYNHTCPSIRARREGRGLPFCLPCVDYIRGKLEVDPNDRDYDPEDELRWDSI